MMAVNGFVKTSVIFTMIQHQTFKILNMKYVFLIILFCTTRFSLTSQDSLRYIMAVDGAGTLSYDWFNFTNQMRYGLGYKFNNLLNVFDYPYSSQISEGAVWVDDRIKNPPNGLIVNNVLGIGHDAGGLALRGASDVNTKLTALILVGTPNQGSGLLKAFYDPDKNQKTMEEWLFGLEKMVENYDCSNCSKLASLRTVIEKIPLNKVHNASIAKGASGYYSQLKMPDTKRTLIIWGNAEGQTLSDMFGTLGSSVSTIDLEGCARESTIDKKGRNVYTGFIQKLRNTQPTSSTSFGQRLKKIKEIDDQQKEIMMCDIMDQKMESEWRLKLVQNTTQKKVHSKMKFCALLTQTVYEEAAKYFLSVVQISDLFKQFCKESFESHSVEPNDLIYTKSEQILDDSYTTIEVKANHFNQQNMSTLGDFIIPYLDGKNGVFFKIPK